MKQYIITQQEIENLRNLIFQGKYDLKTIEIAQHLDILARLQELNISNEESKQTDELS